MNPAPPVTRIRGIGLLQGNLFAVRTINQDERSPLRQTSSCFSADSARTSFFSVTHNANSTQRPSKCPDCEPITGDRRENELQKVFVFSVDRQKNRGPRERSRAVRIIVVFLGQVEQFHRGTNMLKGLSWMFPHEWVVAVEGYRLCMQNDRSIIDGTARPPRSAKSCRGARKRDAKLGSGHALCAGRCSSRYDRHGDSDDCRRRIVFFP